MNEKTESTPLISHTLESLCAELVSGRSIEIEEGGELFQLPTKQSRSIFNWYLKNKPKWTRNNQKEDNEAIVDQLEKEPPEKPSLQLAPTDEDKKIFHLKSIKAHRFAGLHSYGELNHPPDDFEFNFDKPVTVIQGPNGSGKTSLINAIVWCLTGQIYRSQRPPEEPSEIEIKTASEEEDGDNDNNPTFDTLPIIPLPKSEILNNLGNGKLLVDTWVELSFDDSDRVEIGKVRRYVQRTSRGKIELNVQGLSDINVDPISIAMGTIMPGLIPYIQLGKASDLGKAIASLTGMKPLEDLALHAERAQKKLRGEQKKDIEKKIEEKNTEFSKKREELFVLIDDNPKIKPLLDIPEPNSEKDIEDILEKCSDKYEEKQARILEESKSILSETFNPDEKEQREDLQNNVGPAIGAIDIKSIKNLTSSIRFKNLVKLSTDDIKHTLDIINVLQDEASELAKLKDNPDKADRIRLYAKIAGWYKDQEDFSQIPTNCPVCFRSLSEIKDPITEKLIVDHILECMKSDSDYLEKTIEKWESDTISKLSKELPESLRIEITKDLPETPLDLILNALTEELFNPGAFHGCLSELKTSIKSLADGIRESCPQFNKPQMPSFPDCIKEKEGGIRQILKRIVRAIEFAKWRKNNRDWCSRLFEILINQLRDENELSDIPIEEWSLKERLSALDGNVRSTTPLVEANNKIKDMKIIINERTKLITRIDDYLKTADELEHIIKVRKLVEIQVGALISGLSDSTYEWKNKIYNPACTNSPDLTKTDVSGDGCITMDVKLGNTTAPAEQISNTSDLRATLLAFLLAFRQYILEKRGGLSLLLLDDIQELFDKSNRERIANKVPLINKENSQFIIAANDPRFAINVFKSVGNEECEHREIHRLNPNRPCITLGVFSEKIDRLRKMFMGNKEDDESARDYVIELRSYIEDQLLDFCEEYDPTLLNKPTLSPILQYIRKRKNSGNELFTNKPFLNLVDNPIFSPTEEFMGLINKAHHSRRNEIYYNDVYVLRDECKNARELIDAAHDEYIRYNRRDIPQIIPEKPSAPEQMIIKPIEVSIIHNLAAFTHGSPTMDSPDEKEVSTVDLGTNTAIYYLNTDNLGFSASRGMRVIVDLNEGEIPDNSLVIALHADKIYARRLVRYPFMPLQIGLVSEAANPLNRIYSLILPANEVRLLRIKGVLFDGQPCTVRVNGEAVLENQCRIFNQVKIKFCVKGDSALPLALDGQYILGGKNLNPAQIYDLKNEVIAISTDTDGSVFKRIGECVKGAPHVLQFESIGGLGQSLLARTEEVEDDKYSAIPLVMHAREILGVLYD
jgi:hypothetical protein